MKKTTKPPSLSTSQKLSNTVQNKETWRGGEDEYTRHPVVPTLCRNVVNPGKDCAEYVIATYVNMYIIISHKDVLRSR